MLLELLLVTCLVSWSGQPFQVAGPSMESMIALDRSKIYELSSTVSWVLPDWLDDHILDSSGDQIKTDKSEEWTEFMYGTANEDVCEIRDAPVSALNTIRRHTGDFGRHHSLRWDQSRFVACVKISFEVGFVWDLVVGDIKIET